MGFKMKYSIQKNYITPGTKRRSGIKMPRVGFLVAHDTGNDGSTALGNVNYYQNSRNQLSASAHTFIDDKNIIECIPLTTGTPEKAWHVLYEKPYDNQMFGDDANDIAGGVELCYSYKRGKINNAEAYKRYVWYLAYCCYKFNLNPAKHIVGHETLDPGRKTDPTNALSKMGKSFKRLIEDVILEYAECTKNDKERVKYMELAKWQKDELVKTFKTAREKGILSSDQWEKKAANGTITVEELTFLNTVLVGRTVIGVK